MGGRCPLGVGGSTNQGWGEEGRGRRVPLNLHAGVPKHLTGTDSALAGVSGVWLFWYLLPSMGQPGADRAGHLLYHNLGYQAGDPQLRVMGEAKEEEEEEKEDEEDEEEEEEGKGGRGGGRQGGR